MKLDQILKKLNNFPRNQYSLDKSLDLLEIAKDELVDLNINFEPYIFKKKERLKVYDGQDFVRSYNKNFYQNNSMFGFRISNDKILTEKYLSLADIPTTKSKVFNANQLEDAFSYIETSQKKRL